MKTITKNFSGKINNQILTVLKKQARKNQALEIAKPAVYPTKQKDFNNKSIFDSYVNHVINSMSNEDINNTDLLTLQGSKIGTLHASSIHLYACPDNTATRSFLTTGKNDLEISSCSGCYVNKETMRFSKGKVTKDNKLSFTMSKRIIYYYLSSVIKDFNRLYNILNNSIQKNKNKLQKYYESILRVHTAGDIISLDHLNMWIKLAKNNPWLNIFTYTHTLEKNNPELFKAILKANKEVSNFNCLFSIDDINLKYRTIEKKSYPDMNFSYFGIKTKNDLNMIFNLERGKKFLQCPQQLNELIKCVDCKACTKKKNIYFKMH